VILRPKFLLKSVEVARVCVRACAERQFIKELSGFAGERLWLAPKRCLFFYKTGIFNFQQKLKRYIAGNEELCILFVGEATRRIEEKMKL